MDGSADYSSGAFKTKLVNFKIVIILCAPSSNLKLFRDSFLPHANASKEEAWRGKKEKMEKELHLSFDVLTGNMWTSC